MFEIFGSKGRIILKEYAIYETNVACVEVYVACLEVYVAWAEVDVSKIQFFSKLA